MSAKRCFLVLIVFILNCNLASAQNFFWSSAGFEEGAVNKDFKTTAMVGESGRAFLYFDTAGFQNIEDGYDVDFSWDLPGIVGFDAAESLDFDITIQGNPIETRWGGIALVDEVTPDAVTGLFAKHLMNGTGILVDQIPPGNPIVDDGYDTSANAFLVASFDWTATTVGTTSIQIDKSLVINGGVNIGAPFSDFTIHVVPEPNTTTLMVVGLIGFTLQRRR